MRNEVTASPLFESIELTTGERVILRSVNDHPLYIDGTVVDQFGENKPSCEGIVTWRMVNKQDIVNRTPLTMIDRCLRGPEGEVGR